jgi:hypothetical protein
VDADQLPALHRAAALYAYYGEEFKVECPTGSGRMMTLLEVAQELGGALSRIFLARLVRRTAPRRSDDNGATRPVARARSRIRGRTGAESAPVTDGPDERCAWPRMHATAVPAVLHPDALTGSERDDERAITRA